MVKPCIDAVKVNNTRYQKWFGRFSKENSDFLSKTYQSVYEQLTSRPFYVVCYPENVTDFSECRRSNIIAWVIKGSNQVNFCNVYFTLDNPSERARRLVHEESHFNYVGGMDDNCYYPRDCVNLAKQNPDKAVKSADSFSMYATNYDRD